jgi:RNA polymerase sigma-70 factor (ECF subfamily)
VGDFGTISGSWRYDTSGEGSRPSFVVLLPAAPSGAKTDPVPAVRSEGATGERELAQRVARGDASALGEAYDAHHHAVRAFARRLTGSAAAAEDLVHDVFVALPSAIRNFEGRSALRTFILSVAVNHARNARRATARRLGAMERLHAEPKERVESPEEEEERRELAEMLSKMLDELPMDQRVAVVLCIVEERTSGEAAEIAGVPEATMRTRLFHARRKLRDMFEREALRVGAVA